MCIVLKSVQLYTLVATCVYQMCHIPRQDIIDSDRIKKKLCVCEERRERGGGGGGGGACCYKVVDNNAFLMW